MTDYSNYYMKNGDLLYINALVGFNTNNGINVQKTNSLLIGTCPNGNVYEGSLGCLLPVTTGQTFFYVVKLQAVNGQKSSFLYSYSSDPYIRLGDVVGIVAASNYNPNYQIYAQGTTPGPQPDPASILIQNTSWINGSTDDLHQVWVISDASNMGYYNSGCDGTTNSTCKINPTCGLQPPTNIPIIYGQSYVIQNYGEMVDQSTGGNNYVQWYYGNKCIEGTNRDTPKDGNSKPSENSGQGYFVSFIRCTTNCSNYFDYFDINPEPLPSDSDSVNRYGLEWWIYLLIILGLILLIIIVIIIYLVERKKK